MPDLSPRVAELLAGARPLLNERFTRLGGGRSPDGFLRYLRETALPLVEAARPDAAGAVLFALFDAGVAGAERGLIGDEQQSPFEASLLAHASPLAPLLSTSPVRVLRALGNGFHQVERALGEREARAWLAALGGLGALLSTAESLESAGLLLAWRLGLAEARGAALERATTLSAAVCATVLGAPTIDLDAARRFCAPGTSAALGALTVIAQVGGFVGFGGAFARPPRVFVAGDALLATDGEVTLRVFADVFGARLVRTGAPGADAVVAPSVCAVRSADEGVVEVGAHTLQDTRLSGAASVAAHESVAVVALRQRHSLWVLGRREASA